MPWISKIPNNFINIKDFQEFNCIKFCIRRSKSDDILKALLNVVKQGVFFEWVSKREVEVTFQLVDKISIFLEEFLHESATLLHAASFERNYTKRTVFLLQNGKCRLAGKAHVVLNDLSVCLLLVNILRSIFSSGVMVELSESNAP